MQTSTPPRFCPVAQLLAAGEYAKYGWPTVDSVKRPYLPTELHRQRAAEYAVELEKTLEAITGRMTANELCRKLKMHKSTVGNRITELLRQKKIDREKIGSNFVYWRVTK